MRRILFIQKTLVCVAEGGGGGGEGGGAGAGAGAGDWRRRRKSKWFVIVVNYSSSINLYSQP
jgi:hypothetical protein